MPAPCASARRHPGATAFERILRNGRHLLALINDVIEACEAEDGIAKAYESRPALILMDLSLAGKFDGLEATKRLRSAPGFDSTPIVALTAHAMAGDRERCLDAGMDEYVTKPIQPSELFAKIDGIVGAPAAAQPVPVETVYS